MEHKIEFTEEELRYIERYMNDEVEFMLCNEDEQLVFTSILDKAEYWENALNAEEERMATEGCDCIVWLYNRYLIQEGKPPIKKANKKYLDIKDVNFDV